MRKVIDLFLKLLIIIWIILVFAFFLSWTDINEITINGELHILTQTEEFVFSILFSSIFVFASLLAPPVNIIVIYLIYRTVTKNKIRKNSRFDKHNLEYCREHLNKLSPGIISYLKNFNIEFEKDISAHILKLLYEGYLIEENNSFKKTNQDNSLLSQTDLLVLEMIDNNGFGSDIKKQYEKAIEKEAMEQGLITLKSKRWENITIKFIAFILGIILFFNVTPSFLAMGDSEKATVFVALMFILVFILSFCAGLYFIANVFSLLKYKTAIIRTPKGNKITKNTFGLKKFLNDFGALEQSHYQEVYTREYFLIYAVVLSINKTIPKEIFEKCNNIK